MLKQIVNSPYINFIAGIILLITAGVEVFVVVEESNLGGHHGVFLFAILHILKTIPEILHGLDGIEKAKESKV